MRIATKETIILTANEIKKLVEVRNLLHDIYRDTTCLDIEKLCDCAEDSIETLLTDWIEED